MMDAATQGFLDRAVARFRVEGMRALVLMGSVARGDVGRYSDVDLVRFIDQDLSAIPDSGSHLIEGRLVVVSEVGPAAVEDWFTRPEQAVEVMSGVRTARPLWDPDGAFAAIQARARAFVWDAGMQARADRWASQQLVGWVEEVHKGLEGLQRGHGDIGRLLNARHGLSWGLTRVVTVQRGVLLSGDNAFYEETMHTVGATSAWVLHRRRAFGIEGEDGERLSLREQVRAGLRLYVLTVEMLRPSLQPDDAPLIEHTVHLIEAALDRPRDVS